MHKITILQMIGYGDRTRTQAEVQEKFLFQEKCPELPPISQGTFRERGHVRQLKKNPPNKLSDDQKLEVMLMLEENPHTSSRQTASSLNISHSSILRVLTENQMHPYKLRCSKNNVLPTMANLYPAKGNPQLPGNAIWFQQDGAPARHQLKHEKVDVMIAT
ncbi:hypothetical protein NQ318_016429 [Aromia moschata]|uniref:Transposase n=1 Tax=Aromia moschata TaxID=1265417 RepID=A0AAV8Z3L8_9CUCU|nr:hypothetical protein NQ318_016429 [Aromia moschata]